MKCSIPGCDWDVDVGLFYRPVDSGTINRLLKEAHLAGHKKEREAIEAIIDQLLKKGFSYVEVFEAINERLG